MGKRPSLESRAPEKTGTCLLSDGRCAAEKRVRGDLSLGEPVVAGCRRFAERER
jgi:hypothetical protein